MNKSLLALGMLAAAGVSSICDLCKPLAAGAVGSLVSVAQAASRPAAELKRVTLRVEGMTCGGCVIGVRKVLARLEGVSTTDVSYENQRAIVTYDPAKVTVGQMIAAIGTLGYKATVVTA
ncbi:MAG: hypothetical protein NVS4B3_19230 [Gemmatimonadaceae bacterium]